MGDFRRDYTKTRYLRRYDRIDIEILVLGTGDKIMFVQRVREALAKMGMQVDVQDTV